MGEKLDKLITIRDYLEEEYVEVTAAIKKEMLVNSLVHLASTPGVMQYLTTQKLKDCIADLDKEEEVLS